MIDAYPQLQRAIAAAQAGPPARVYIPGNVSLSQPLRIVAPIHLYGDGIGASSLTPLASNPAIIIDTPLAVKLSDFAITYARPAQAGVSAIILQCSDTSGAGIYGNASSVFRDLSVLNADTSFAISQAQTFVIDNFKSLQHQTTGISISNTNWPDAGDSVVTNCYLQGANLQTTTCGIQWTGDGACSLVNNKILTHRYGILVQLQAAAQTRQLFIMGNSIDGASTAAVSFWPQGTGSFGGVIVTGNIFNLAHNGISAPTPPIGKWINSMIVGQNNWYPDAPGGAYLDASAVTSLVNVDMVMN